MKFKNYQRKEVTVQTLVGLSIRFGPGEEKEVRDDLIEPVLQAGIVPLEEVGDRSAREAAEAAAKAAEEAAEREAEVERQAAIAKAMRDAADKAEGETQATPAPRRKAKAKAAPATKNGMSVE